MLQGRKNIRAHLVGADRSAAQSIGEPLVNEVPVHSFFLLKPAFVDQRKLFVIFPFVVRQRFPYFAEPSGKILETVVWELLLKPPPMVFGEEDKRAAGCLRLLKAEDLQHVLRILGH
jgi:hypothetical protein